MAEVNSISGGGEVNISQIANARAASKTQRADAKDVNETKNAEDEKKIRREDNSNREEDNKRIEDERRKEETIDVQANSARDRKLGTNIDKLV